MRLEPRYAKLARRNQEATIPKKGQKGFQPVLDTNMSSIADEQERKAATMAAKDADLSRETYRKAKKDGSAHY